MSVIPQAISISLDYGFFWPAIAFSLSIILSYLCYPIIIRVSKAKKLMAVPNHRSVHRLKTPNLGGIGIFLTINLIITFLGNYFEDSTLLSLLGAITILFFTGLIDDLVGIKPKSKIACQVIAALSIIVVTDLRIDNLHGLLGITQLAYPVSLLLTVAFYVIIINAYNLIDGVDGLAGSYAIAVTSFFGIFYFANGNQSMFFLSISIVGSLISFLIFNFSKKEKIFMGDTGSMVIGFLLAYQAISFMSVEFNPNFMIQNVKAPIYVLALFSFPLIDTARIFLLRIINRKSPFSADKNHIHHVFLEYGLKHWKIALLGSVFTMIIVVTVFIFNELGVNKQISFLVGLWALTVVIVNNFNLTTKLKEKSTDDAFSDSIDKIKNKEKGKRIVLRDLA